MEIFRIGRDKRHCNQKVDFEDNEKNRLRDSNRRSNYDHPNIHPAACLRETVSKNRSGACEYPDGRNPIAVRI
jgi:hypothetical protein